MNRRNTLSLCATIALGLALLPGSAVSQQKPLKEQLVGTWTIVSNDNVAPDGTKRQIFGANPKGILYPRHQWAIRGSSESPGPSQIQSQRQYPFGYTGIGIR